MSWKGYVTVLLSFANCIAAQPITILRSSILERTCSLRCLSCFSRNTVTVRKIGTFVSANGTQNGHNIVPRSELLLAKDLLLHYLTNEKQSGGNTKTEHVPPSELQLVKALLLHHLTNEQNGNNSKIECVPQSDLTLVNAAKSLHSTDLAPTKDECEIRQEVANEKLEKCFEETRIMRHYGPGKLTSEDLQVLRGCQPNRYWRPGSALMFQSKFFVADNKEKFDLTQKLFVTNADCLSDKEPVITGFIFPEAFLKKFDVDVIFPSMEMFEPHLPIFDKQPEDNKKEFEKCFGWKAKSPIKMAVIFSRDSQTDYDVWPLDNHPSWAKFRAARTFQWLKSLPEGKQMHILFTQGIYTKFCTPATGRNEKDMGIVLFGGDNTVVDSFSLESETSERLSTNVINKKEFKDWKANVVDRSPQKWQRIAFLTTSNYNRYDIQYFKELFGVDIPLIVQPALTAHRFSATFTIISFSEH